VTDPVTDAAVAGYRLAASQFASGIVVVTTSGGHAAAVSAFASVSLEPPLVLFCAAKTSPFRDAVLAAGEWAVSVLPDQAEQTARWLTPGNLPAGSLLPTPQLSAQRSSPPPRAQPGSPPARPQLDGVPHHPGPVTGIPLLAGALATLECRTGAVHDGGDHTIIIGQVLAAATPDDTADGTPLLRYAGAYRSIRLLD
jgi:flavin reductase (DIM6/NTAB) family NADH-FMN oxidoreductase RutF